MFGLEAATCCNGNDGANGAAVALRLPATSARTINARDVAFPMVNPFSPVVKARIPVTGLTRFPMRRPLGRRYYGLSGLGFGPEIDWPTPTIAGQGVSLPGSSGGTLQSILNAINSGLATIPAIISANRSQPYYNPSQIAGQQAQTVYGQPVTTGAFTGSAGTSIGAQAGSALGNVGDTIGRIVTENPLLVLGGGLALVLLMMKPPSGRR